MLRVLLGSFSTRYGLSNIGEHLFLDCHTGWADVKRDTVSQVGRYSAVLRGT